MKKIMIINLFIMLMTGSCFAMQFKSYPFVKFEAGKSTSIKDVYFAEGTIGYKIKFWQIELQTYGGWLTWSLYDNEYNPFMEIYSINQKFIYNNFFIRYQHYCAHMVENKNTRINKYNSDGNYWYTEYKPSPYWWGGYNTTLSLGFEYDFK